jgi:hypothetical protein
VSRPVALKLQKRQVLAGQRKPSTGICDYEHIEALVKGDSRKRYMRLGEESARFFVELFLERSVHQQVDR